jgi:hypothetical protein
MIIPQISAVMIPIKTKRTQSRINRGLRVTNDPIPARVPFPSIPRRCPQALGIRQDQSNGSPGGYIGMLSHQDSRSFLHDPDIAKDFSICYLLITLACVAMRHFYCASSPRQDRIEATPTWLASVNSKYLSEHPDRESATARFEADKPSAS